MIWSASCSILGILLALSGLAIGEAEAAQTAGSATQKTRLIVKLATTETLPLHPRFEPDPPTIVLEFPPAHVTGTLPERSVIAHGAIQEIHTLYAAPSGSEESRWVQALRIQLRGPYRYEVRSEPGRVVIEIAHPGSIAGEHLEVGLAGGIVVSGMFSPVFNERFRAMQEALMRAQPQPAVWSHGFFPGPPTAPALATPRARQAAPLPAQKIEGQAGSAARQAGRATARTRHPSSGWWMLSGLGALGLGGLGWRWRRRTIRTRLAGRPGTSVPAAIRIIDQLVWRAFERQGYQLVQMVEVGEPLGLMRVVMKEARKAALLCLGNGMFFEKTAVEQFLQAMRRVQAVEGFLVTPGSFTIPAQRLAKEHDITLVGREQLVELLSEGAMQEAYARQLQQLHAQVDEAKETLAQYAAQLDTIRRQRNEASWVLGEERAKAAKSQTQADELNQLVAHWQAQADQWQRAAEADKKRWEESQWYLGEAQASLEHLREQVRQMEAIAQELEEAKRQRDEANWYLGETRAALEELRRSQAVLEDLQRLLEAERAHRQIVEEQLTALRAGGERRRARRVSRADATVEARQDGSEPAFRGALRDVSQTGMGFGVEWPPPTFPFPIPLQLRLHLPGGERPIEATARVIWHRQDVGTNRLLGGCEFLDMPADSRDALARALATST